MESKPRPANAIQTAMELMRLIQDDMKASCSIMSSMKSDNSDVDELIWLLKEDNEYLKVSSDKMKGETYVVR